MRRASFLPRKPPPPVITTFMCVSVPYPEEPGVCTEPPLQSMLGAYAGDQLEFVAARGSRGRRRGGAAGARAAGRAADAGSDAAHGRPAAQGAGALSPPAVARPHPW